MMKILLAIDGSESARVAVDLLISFPFPRDSEVIGLTVIEADIFGEEGVEQLGDAQQAELRTAEKSIWDEQERLLKDELLRLREAGWAGSDELRAGHPAEVIIQVAEKFAIDLIIVGSHGRTGIRRFLLGSVSDYVLEHAPCSVLIVKKPAAHDLEPVAVVKETVPMESECPLRLLLTYDDSQSARKAVELCASLPLDKRTEVIALTVLPLVAVYRQDIRQRLSGIWQQQKKAALTALEQVSDELHRTIPRVSVQLKESADVSQEILDVAEETNCDLIVLGHKGKGAVVRFLLGSVKSSRFFVCTAIGGDEITPLSSCIVSLVRMAKSNRLSGDTQLYFR